MFGKLCHILFLLNLYHQAHSNEDWAFDNAPGIAMEYKVHIDPGKEDCYWQYVHPAATIYVNMQVLKGGDGMAGMAVRNPNNEIVHPYKWDKSSEYEENAAIGGYYSICIDNQFSKFSAKLINLYITTFRYDLWEKYSEELEKLDVSVKEFTTSIVKVDQHIHEILQHLSFSRAREGRDFELLLDNYDYIQYWSIAQCIAIIATCTIQVYSLKKFFNVNTTQTKSSLRA